MLRRLAARIAILRLCRLVRREVEARGVTSSVSWLGAYYIHPKNLALIIKVERDEDKRRLLDDPSLQLRLKSQLAAVNYPSSGRAGVSFDIESQETVDRDFDGNWYYRFK